MTLTDAGPLIAIIDADEPDHDACLAALDNLALLWRLVRTGRLVIADLSTTALDRSAQLVDKYADRPMDLADATLVAIAEEQGHRRIFTLDPDFHIYRIRGRQPFHVVPGR